MARSSTQSTVHQFSGQLGEVGDELGVAATYPQHPRGLVDPRLDRPRQQCATGDQVRVEDLQLAVAAFRADLRDLEGLMRLRIRQILVCERDESGELAAAAGARGGRDLRDRRGR